MAELRQRGEGPYVSSSSTSIPSTNKKSYDKEDDIVVDIRERDRDGDRDSIRKASSTSPSPPVGSYTLRSPSSFGDGPFRLKSLQNVPVQWMVTLKAMCLSFYAEGRRFAQQQNRVVAVVVFLWLFFIMTNYTVVLSMLCFCLLYGAKYVVNRNGLYRTGVMTVEVVMISLLLYLVIWIALLHCNTTWGASKTVFKQQFTKSSLLTFVPEVSLGHFAFTYEKDLTRPPLSEYFRCKIQANDRAGGGPTQYVNATQCASIENLVLRRNLIFKPNICSTSTRNVAVIKNTTMMIEYIRDRRDRGHDRETIVQEYAPGKEASIFYRRMPYQANGVIQTCIKKTRRNMSIYGRFPWSFIRIRNDLISPELTELVDRLAKQVPGLHICRFDVKFSSFDDFMNGTDFKLMEINQGIPIGDYADDRLTSNTDAYLPVLYARKFYTYGSQFFCGVYNILAGNSPGIPRLVRTIGAIWRRGVVCNSAEHFYKAIP